MCPGVPNPLVVIILFISAQLAVCFGWFSAVSAVNDTNQGQAKVWLDQVGVIGLVWVGLCLCKNKMSIIIMIFPIMEVFALLLKLLLFNFSNSSKWFHWSADPVWGALWARPVPELVGGCWKSAAVPSNIGQGQYYDTLSLPKIIQRNTSHTNLLYNKE